MKKTLNKISIYFKKLLSIINKPEMKILPGQLAFFLVMSVFPILTLIGLVATSFNISMDTLIEFMRKAMPLEVSETLIPFIQGNGIDLKIGFSMIIGFIIASNGAQSLIVTSNRLYNIKDSNYLSRRIKALFLTILLVLLTIFTIVVLAFGDNIISFISNIGILKNIENIIKSIYGILKIPGSLLIIFFIIKLIYVITPDSKIPSKDTTKGALFTTFGVTIVTLIYSYYVANFSNYDIFYGGLTNIVIMMMWIYLISYIIVIGISINTHAYVEKAE